MAACMPRSYSLMILVCLMMVQVRVLGYNPLVVLSKVDSEEPDVVQEPLAPLSRYPQLQARLKEVWHPSTGV